jgi:hypothetical protein
MSEDITEAKVALLEGPTFWNLWILKRGSGRPRLDVFEVSPNSTIIIDGNNFTNCDMDVLLLNNTGVGDIIFLGGKIDRLETAGSHLKSYVADPA